MSEMLDEEKAQKPLTVRERISFRLILLLIKMVYPARWSSNLDKAFDEIRAEFK